jgi:hypothetical protein
MRETVWGLVRRRECLVPTWRGWLGVAATCVVLAYVAAREIHHFLAVNDPLPGGVLVVEGWATDYVLEVARTEYRRNHYDELYGWTN